MINNLEIKRGDKGERSHQNHAVKTVQNPAVARHDVAEIFKAAVPLDHRKGEIPGRGEKRCYHRQHGQHREGNARIIKILFLKNAEESVRIT